MDKATFLRREYDRLLASGGYMYSAWRDNFERFQADLWDMTPNSQAWRFLAPIDPGLGIAPGNVEWHFPRIRRVTAKPKAAPVKAKAKPKPPKLTKEEKAEQKRAVELARREAKRAAIAEEYKRWEERRRAG